MIVALEKEKAATAKPFHDYDKEAKTALAQLKSEYEEEVKSLKTQRTEKLTSIFQKYQDDLYPICFDEISTKSRIEDLNDPLLYQQHPDYKAFHDELETKLISYIDDVRIAKGEFDDRLEKFDKTMNTCQDDMNKDKFEPTVVEFKNLLAKHKAIRDLQKKIDAATSGKELVFEDIYEKKGTAKMSLENFLKEKAEESAMILSPCLSKVEKSDRPGDYNGKIVPDILKKLAAQVYGVYEGDPWTLDVVIGDFEFSSSMAEVKANAYGGEAHGSSATSVAVESKTNQGGDGQSAESLGEESEGSEQNPEGDDQNSVSMMAQKAAAMAEAAAFQAAKEELGDMLSEEELREMIKRADLPVRA